MTELFNKISTSPDRLIKFTTEALHEAEDGELFIEHHTSESVGISDQKISNASFDVSSGFGLRAIEGDLTAYSYGSDFSEATLAESAKVAKSVQQGANANINLTSLSPRPGALYTNRSPLTDFSFAEKVSLLDKIDRYLRKRDPRVSQVSASILCEHQLVAIVRPDGRLFTDIRPLVRVNISVVVASGDRREQGYSGVGGRLTLAPFLAEEAWKAQAEEALRTALLGLEAVPGPAGELPVVLGHGFPGVLLHEAVGHGLEGDFNRKKSSAFSDKLGQRVAAPGVTVIDAGNMAHRRGSLNIDDEGTATRENILIEDGILKGYMQDRMNAKLMKTHLTGNGRRESFAYQPMPRMTNTFMLAGKEDPKEMISSVKHGIYAANFSGGQVDITSGKFVFSASEAYLIENGKITHPLKDMTLIGNGPDILTRIKAIGNDLNLDKGVGTCGKSGQSVPVGVGQPSLLIDKITVGGSGS